MEMDMTATDKFSASLGLNGFSFFIPETALTYALSVGFTLFVTPQGGKPNSQFNPTLYVFRSTELDGRDYRMIARRVFGQPIRIGAL
jgi:hypothetical protein